MDERRWIRVKELVTLALELPTEDRRVLLESENDAEIRREASELIAASVQVSSTGALQTPFAQELGVAPDRDTRVGPWKLQEQIGIGGMGAVYRAVRVDGAYERTVALKLLHRDANTAELVRRLEVERNVLARLEHPNIARLYDGGVTGPEYEGGAGVPYLAMEYVDGETVTDYSHARELAIRDRIDLFLQVCDAVAYAHRNLIVHRDLKPSNILVTSQGECRLLDFGIAKLLADAGEDVLLTQTGLRAMTPAYAAPEQVRHQTITTATDVYSLGILLYQLLTGTRPYDLSELSPAEIERTICVDEPPRPSTVLGDSGLASDLDTVVMKALAKEPGQRYASAEALGEDLRRFLGGLPIVARVPTVGYRFRKFVGRNRTLTAAAAIVVVALLSGFSVALWQARVAESERDAARMAAARAQEESDRAEAVSDFLAQILRAPNDSWYVESNVKGPDVPIRAVLDAAAVRVDSDFADRSLIRADLHNILGETYQALGLLEEAEHHHRTSLSLREELFTAPNPEIAEALYYLASVMKERDPRQRIEFLWRAVEMQRQVNEGNNFPFMVHEIAWYLRLGGASDVARKILYEATVFVDTSFVAGRESFRYRDYVGALLAMSMVELEVANEDTEQAIVWFARVDSLIARIPEQELPSSQRILLLRLEGSMYRVESRYPEAEELLLAAYDNARDQPLSEQAISQVDWIGYHLSLLYNDWSHPEQAALYRTHVEAVESLQAELTTWIGQFDFRDLSDQPRTPPGIVALQNQ